MIRDLTRRHSLDASLGGLDPRQRKQLVDPTAFRYLYQGSTWPLRCRLERHARERRAIMQLLTGRQRPL